MSRNPSRIRADAEDLRDRLKCDGRHRDAQVLQHLLVASATSSGLNGVLHRDNTALRDRIRQAELEGSQS